jgi:hypothetical protein
MPEFRLVVRDVEVCGRGEVRLLTEDLGVGILD